VTNLFIELYLDECVDILVADLLRARGFTSITTREAGQLHNNDVEQLDYAVSQRKAFLTHNRADFEAVHQAYLGAGKAHYGIIVAVRHPPYELVRRLLRILNYVTADEMQDQLRHI
jgi:predicted nuclease of predicted toxin-antitoxin system